MQLSCAFVCFVCWCPERACKVGPVLTSWRDDHLTEPELLRCCRSRRMNRRLQWRPPSVHTEKIYWTLPDKQGPVVKPVCTTTPHLPTPTTAQKLWWSYRVGGVVMVAGEWILLWIHSDSSRTNASWCLSLSWSHRAPLVSNQQLFKIFTNFMQLLWYQRVFFSFKQLDRYWFHLMIAKNCLQVLKFRSSIQTERAQQKRYRRNIKFRQSVGGPGRVQRRTKGKGADHKFILLAKMYKKSRICTADE